MRFINKKFMLFMTHVFLLAGIGSTIANYSTSVIQGEATPLVSDEKNHVLVKADFGSSTANSTFSISKSVSTSSFDYEGSYNILSASGPWLNLKTSTAFSKNVESGSDTNKWYLTGIAISYSRYTASAGNPLTLAVKYPASTSANTLNIISTTGLTNSTSQTNLNNNRTSYSNLSLFTQADAVTTFKLVPGAANFVVESITLYYQIDYSNC
jgi:hypothetical protein